ncbi:MAG TPA: PAS domain S-box protein [Burkholderiaceae bacterium]|nr:PAS domain S-box protein [Burkholderiaceae bacterium]
MHDEPASFAAHAGSGLFDPAFEPAREAVGVAVRPEAFYRALVEGMSEGILLRDADGIITFASPQFREMLGYSTQELVGTRAAFLLRPDQLDRWQRTLDAAVDGRPQQFENDVVRKDGRVITVSVSRRPLFDAAGIFRGTMALVSDVTEARRAGMLLQQLAETTAPHTGDEFFRAAVRFLQIGLGLAAVFVTECANFPTTRVRMLAYWRQGELRDNIEFNLAGTPCEETVHSGRVFCCPSGVASRFSAERGSGFDGYIGVPFFDPAGRCVIGHLALFDDKPLDPNLVQQPMLRIICARAEAELNRKWAALELSKSEEKYRLLVENQTDLLVKLDRAGKYLFVSPSFCECFGTSEAQLLGQPFALDVNPVDRAAFEQAQAAVLAGAHRSHAEARVLTASGWRWLAWECSAILGEQGQVAEIIASGRDVTERKRAEEQARQHLQQLAHVTRLSSMGEMASAIAHELNQPLAAIVTFNQACTRLLRSGQASVDEITATMERVAAEADRASQIIKHLRSFVRKDEAQLIPVQLSYLVQEVLRLVQPEARQSAVEIHTELADDLPPVQADNIQIQQVLLNLIRNAVDAINGADVRRREVRIATRAAGDGMVEVCIEDSGPGFDEETAARLFEPFFTTKSHGMGIGLSISRSIVEAHRGRIYAGRAVEGGASFRIVLPAV